jgi:hypothetical protein
MLFRRCEPYISRAFEMGFGALIRPAHGRLTAEKK